MKLPAVVEKTLTSLYTSEEKYHKAKQLYDQELSTSSNILAETELPATHTSVIGVGLLLAGFVCSLAAMTPIAVVSGITLAGAGIISGSLLIGAVSFAILHTLQPESTERELYNYAKEFGLEYKNPEQIIEGFANNAVSGQEDSELLTGFIKSKVEGFESMPKEEFESMQSSLANKLDELEGMTEALESALGNQVTLAR